MAELIFRMRAGMFSSRVLNVAITLDEGETAADAVACLRASRPEDWSWFESDGFDVRAFRDNELAEERVPLPITPRHLSEACPHDVEPYIPHNWGIGDADLFDHLDPETRELVREAIAHEDVAMDETLVDWAAFNVGRYERAYG